MQLNLNLRTTLLVLSLLAAGCVGETSGDETDTTSDPSGPTDTGSDPVEPSEPASDPVEPSEPASDPVEPSETASDPVEPSEPASDPVEPTDTASDTSLPSTTTPSDASANPTDSEPSATDTSDAGPHPDEALTEDDISVCSNDDECIVVDYAHCCGATKRAINAAYDDEYTSHPEWQSYFEDGPCATIGICRDDSDVTSAQCARDGDDALDYCSLVFTDPGSTPDGAACQANTECESNVCIRTAAPSGAFGELKCGQCMTEATRDFACDEDSDCCNGPCCLGCGEREGLCVLQ